MEDIPIQPAVLNRREAARHLRAGWTKFREEIEPELPYIQRVQPNGIKLYRIKDLDAWLAKNLRHPAKNRAS